MGYDYAGKVAIDELVSNIKAKYATKASIPTNVSQLTNDADYQSGSEVSALIAAAIEGVTQFDYEIVSELPAEGVKGVIYLVANSGSGQNIYDEDIWIQVGSNPGYYEKFGEKMIELVEYVGDTVNITVSDGTGADEGKKVISISSAMATSLGLADTAIQSVASAGNTIEVSGAGTDKNLEVASSIVAGAGLGATALQSVASTGDTINVTGEGTSKNLEVASSIVAGAGAGATAVQPADLVPITSEYIDSLFADTSSSASEG